MAEKGLQAAFDMFCQVTGMKNGQLTLDNVKKWLKQAGVIGNDTGITDEDANNAISKASEDKKTMDFEELQKCIEDVAQQKGIEPKELMDKLANSGPPKAGPITDAGGKFEKRF
ncbi:uncharacterized protein NPIL_501231 [Nephila pilipes]|uniref:Uncharacterized protein n=1 Tax=Nephila pilipes TaxID=299642 RepID=A0A8X6QK42_NEPPI|nr:uncharacterized protein NPIL_501231 [Nephila pilipes]